MDCKIKDRFDLTLECIRKYYIKEENPLSDILNRFNYYFSLFNDFKVFCEFYFLQDLTKNNFSQIRYFLPFCEFKINPYPKDISEYNEYKHNCKIFVNNRNKRLLEYINILNEKG